MSFLFHVFSKMPSLGRCCFGLFLVLAVAFPGCKHWGLNDEASRDEGLRRNDLALPARQARASQNPDKSKKSADDPWMSEEAQRVSHDLD